MKSFCISSLALVLSLTACTKSSNRQAANQTSDTNLVAVNQPRIGTNDTGVAVRVQVDADELKGTIQEAAGAAKEKLGRAAEKIDVAARDFSERISRSLRDDPKYSATSKGVEVTSNQGKVTLKGTVKTEAERIELEKRIRELTGATQIVNQIKVGADLK
jgi:osmotically-inducible protein OsmY